MKVKRILRSIRYRLGKDTLSDYISSLRDHGVHIGENTVFFEHKTNVIDTQRPWLLHIGAYCKICRGVVILTHDYSRSVIRRVYGEVIGEARKTHIGDNVFIGINSIVLMGAHIGNNVIIGTGSVVSGNIPDNVVAAGIPARVICTLDEYYHKRKKLHVDEAKLCAREFYYSYGKKPTINDMGAFYPLYLDRTLEALKQNQIKTKLSGDDEVGVISCFLKSERVYGGFEEFFEEAIL